MRKVAFITLLCEDYNGDADMEMKQISNIIKQLKKWKHQKTTVLSEN